MSQSPIPRDVRLVGKPSPGKDSTPGHFTIFNSQREVMLCMQFGRARIFSQPKICSCLRLHGSNPSSGKDLRFSHDQILIFSREEF